MINTVENADLELERAQGQLESAQQRTLAARTKLSELETAERTAHALVNQARQRVAEFEREPAAAAELVRVVARLRVRLAAASSSSPTAQTVREALTDLERSPTSATARLEAVRRLAAELADSYSRDRAIWDARVPALPGRETK